MYKPYVITGTQADTVITLGHAQYRQLADLCKAHAGESLNLTSVEDMGDAWGAVNYWALPTIDDVTKPDQKYRERAYIYVVSQLNTAEVRAAGKHRPECDWSKLRNGEIYQFLVWHEIGHLRDNFYPWSVRLALDLPPEAEEAKKHLKYVNEILADRFAWDKIRPGQSMPLTKEGRINSERNERAIEDLSRYFKRAEFPLKSLEIGQYRHVPAYMLSSERKAAFVGPDIHPELLRREIAYYQRYLEKNGRSMHGVAL